MPHSTLWCTQWGVFINFYATLKTMMFHMGGGGRYFLSSLCVFAHKLFIIHFSWKSDMLLGSGSGSLCSTPTEQYGLPNGERGVYSFLCVAHILAIFHPIFMKFGYFGRIGHWSLWPTHQPHESFYNGLNIALALINLAPQNFQHKPIMDGPSHPCFQKPISNPLRVLPKPILTQWKYFQRSK